MKILVSGSAGLIGSELVEYFDSRGHLVVGFDNDMRGDFFGPAGSTLSNLERLRKVVLRYEHESIDVRSQAAVDELFRAHGPFDLIVHCAAQPSHDLSAKRPRDDFDVNVVGTVNMLEAMRQLSPDAVFVFMSTNKVYGDVPNELSLIECETRWDFADPANRRGIDETMRIDRSRHSIFGAGKVGADVMTQEYGRTFGLKTHCLRAGCLTGRNQQGVELHGFLSYLVKTQISGGLYRIYGYKGKQVRDNIHSVDVASAIEAICANPHPGGVYNIGGERANSCSILEAFEKVRVLTGIEPNTEYVDRARDGDHCCYITDMTRFRSDYPSWEITRSLDDIFSELVAAWRHVASG